MNYQIHNKLTDCLSRYLSYIVIINPLRANLTKWSNTLKQFIGNLPTNCLSVFDHFAGFKGLNSLASVFSSYFTFTINGDIANNYNYLFVLLFSVLFAMFSNTPQHLMRYTFTSFFFFALIHFLQFFHQIFYI